MREFARFLPGYVLLCGISIAITAGCGGGPDGPSRASVSGKLTIDGFPIEGVEVHFQNPDFPNHGSFAVTDSEGKYKLVQGAAVGSNTVFFSRIEGGDIVEDPEAGMDAGQFEAIEIGSVPGKAKKQVGPRQIVPAEFATSASKLRFDVPAEGTTSANFEL